MNRFERDVEYCMKFYSYAPSSKWRSEKPLKPIMPIHEWYSYIVEFLTYYWVYETV